MPAPILTIYNQHTPACGTPPAFSNEFADLYIGYFANRYGEQWIFTFDRATSVASLRAETRTGQLCMPSVTVRVDGLTLNLEEAAWLWARWSGPGLGSEDLARLEGESVI